VSEAVGTAGKLIRMTRGSAGPITPWMNVVLPKAEVIEVAEALLTTTSALAACQSDLAAALERAEAAETEAAKWESDALVASDNIVLQHRELEALRTSNERMLVVLRGIHRRTVAPFGPNTQQEIIDMVCDMARCIVAAAPPAPAADQKLQRIAVDRLPDPICPDCGLSKSQHPAADGPGGQAR